jgi:hypothetical protein
MGPELIVIGAFAGVIVVAAVLTAAMRGERGEDALSSVIRELELTGYADASGNEERVVAIGKVDGVDVQIREGLGSAVTAECSAPITIHPGKPSRQEGIGDARFDASANVAGDRVAILCLLHAKAREAVLSLLERGGGNVEQGRVRRLAERTRESLLDAVRRVIAAAKLLGDRQVHVSTLLRNLQEDPLPAYRAQCFHVLLRDFPSARETQDAARFLAQGNDPVRTIARLLTNASATLADTAPETIAEAIFRLPPDAREPVLRRLASSGANAEPALLALLALTEGPLHPNDLDGVHDEYAVSNVLRTLGLAGTAVSVERLKPHASGLLTASGVKEAAREAIEAIQGRAKAGAGGLTLSASGLDGAITLSGDAGAVSLADEKKR